MASVPRNARKIVGKTVSRAAAKPRHSVTSRKIRVPRKLSDDVTAKKCPTSCCRVTTPIGLVVVECCDNGLHSLSQDSDEFLPVPRQPVLVESSDCMTPTRDRSSKLVVAWLEDFFNGNVRDSASIPLCFAGQTPFKVAVWTTLRDKTSQGDRLSYRDLAELAGRPGSARAVGQAMATNPFQLLVPCHRVLLHCGKVGHYARQRRDDVKRWLLEMEAAVRT